MTVKTTSVYTCDRDGVTVSEPVSGGLPEGWSSVQVSTMPAYVAPAEGSPPMPMMPMMPRQVSMVVCPACTTVVADAMKRVTPAKKA